MLRRILICAVMWCLVFNPVFVPAQTGLDGDRRRVEDGKRYALVVGVSDYTAGWTDLPGVQNDIAAVKNALEGQNFQVQVLLNPTREILIAGIERFIKDYADKYENRLLIYFAGHGYTESLPEGKSVGYIIPSDAPLPKDNSTGFQYKAVRISTIKSLAGEIAAKQALFVFDSNFTDSSFFAEISIHPFFNPELKNQRTRPAVNRQFIIAGEANQNMRDESIFRRFFVRGIEGGTDTNHDGYVLASELADYLKENVTNYSQAKQIPQYGKTSNYADFILSTPLARTSSRGSICTVCDYRRMAFHERSYSR